MQPLLLTLQSVNEYYRAQFIFYQTCFEFLVNFLIHEENEILPLVSTYIYYTKRVYFMEFGDVNSKESIIYFNILFVWPFDEK